MIPVPPFVQSDDSRCGPASLKMVLNYYGVPVSEDEVCNRTNHSYALGCTNASIKNAFESYGFTCTIKNKATLDDIRECIKRGIPPIVDWFSTGVDPGPGDMANGHSSVVVGIDDKKIYILDPENGQIRDILHNDWLRVWYDWQNSPTISPDNLRIRQLIVAYK